MPEVLLSLFVLSIGLVSIVSVISASLRYSYITRDAIVASELAQEGVELVRNVRDNDFVSGGDGFASFSNGEHCRIDWDDSVGILDCNPGQNPLSRYRLQYQGGIYAHVNSNQERYSRYIYIDYDNGGGKRALVRSFVIWGSGTLPPGNGNGNPASCNASVECVYTEAFLTSWR